MQFIDEKREELIKIGANVKVTFAVSDINNDSIKAFLAQSYGKTDKEMKSRRALFDDAVNYVNRKRREQSKEEVSVVQLDIFIPIAFTAIDYKEDVPGTSVIHAKHYLVSGEAGGKTNAFNLSVHPKTRLYERYREQILLIEKHEGKLAKRFTETEAKE